MRFLSSGGLCLLFVYVASAGAQEIDFDRTESWAMKYFSAVALMSGYGPPDRTDPGSLSFAVEAGWVPHLSRAERTVGFDGTNVEDLNKTSVFGRLRVDLALPWGLHATLGYVPPIELDGARPDVLSLAIGREIWAGDKVRLGLRAHAMGGEVEGDFTCEEDAVAAGDDPVANPLGCEEASRDRMRFDALGLEGGIGFTPWSAGGPEIYAAASASRIEPRFQVNARYRGFTDRTVIETEGTLVTLSAGLRDELAGRWSWAAEAVYAPLTVRRPPEREEENDDLLTARTMLKLSWR